MTSDTKCRRSPSGPACDCGGSFLLRVPLIPLSPLFNGDVSLGGSGWALDDIRARGGVFLFWLLQHDVRLDPVVWFAVQAPERGSIERVTAHVVAQSDALPDGMPKISLVKMPLAADNYESFETVDRSPDVNAYGAPHVIELTSTDFGGAPLPLSNDFAYWIRVIGETGTNARSNRLKITGITLSISP